MSDPSSPPKYVAARRRRKGRRHERLEHALRDGRSEGTFCGMALGEVEVIRGHFDPADPDACPVCASAVSRG